MSKFQMTEFDSVCCSGKFDWEFDSEKKVKKGRNNSLSLSSCLVQLGEVFGRRRSERKGEREKERKREKERARKGGQVKVNSAVAKVVQPQCDSRKPSHKCNSVFDSIVYLLDCLMSSIGLN